MVACPPTADTLAGRLSSDEVLEFFWPRTVRVVVEFARDGCCFWIPAGFRGFDRGSFFASAWPVGSFLATLLTSPRAVLLRLPKVPVVAAVVDRFVERAFLGGSPTALSRAAALARVRRVVPAFSAFSSVTVRLAVRALVCCQRDAASATGRDETRLTGGIVDVCGSMKGYANTQKLKSTRKCRYGGVMRYYQSLCQHVLGEALQVLSRRK